MKESKNVNSGNTSTIEFGGISKNILLNKLRESGIMMNEFSEIIFSSVLFQTSTEKQSISIIEASIKDIGFTKGATLSEISERIKEYGYADCPLEVGPYLRLKYTDQKEVDSGNIKNQNPPGALVLFSIPLENDDDFPKGFYLRKMDGKLWLRGYRCSMDYVWIPEDRFIFKLL